MDFLADEMHGLRVRCYGGADAFFRTDFHLHRRAATAIVVVTATALWRSAFAAISRAARARPAVAIVATGRTILTSRKSLGFALGGFACGACPGGSQRKAGQEAAQWIGIGITHDAQFNE